MFWLLFLASGFYGAYMFIPPYAGFYMLRTEVEEEARTTGRQASSTMALDDV